MSRWARCSNAGKERIGLASSGALRRGTVSLSWKGRERMGLESGVMATQARIGSV